MFLSWSQLTAVFIWIRVQIKTCVRNCYSSTSCLLQIYTGIINHSMRLGVFQGSASEVKFQLQKRKTMQTSVAIPRPALEKSTAVISCYSLCFGPHINICIICVVRCVCSSMVEPEERPSVAGQRLGAPESMGISTLEHGQRPPTMPPGRQVPIRIQMLDDTQEVFEVSVRHYLLSVGFYFLALHWTALHCILFYFIWIIAF